MSGLLKLVEVLPLTRIERLECAPAPQVIIACVSAPVGTPTLSPFLTLPLACRLYCNEIGDEGASALSAVLKETQITHLECAAAQQSFALCQRPLTSFCSLTISTLLLVHSLEDNDLTDEAKKALQDAAGSSVCIDF